MHDGHALIHSCLRSGDEVFDGSAACPGCIDEGARVEDRTEVFPFSSIPSMKMQSKPQRRTRLIRNLPIHRPTFGKLTNLETFKDEIIGSVVADCVSGASANG